MNAIVIDTNALISFLEKGTGMASLLARFDRLVIPAAVDAEFRAGLDLATNTGRRFALLLDDMLKDESVEFHPAGRDESLKYAMLYRVLRKQGTPIPINDIWIAATALVCNAPICTFDRHFRHVPLLQVVDASSQV